MTFNLPLEKRVEAFMEGLNSWIEKRKDEVKKARNDGDWEITQSVENGRYDRTHGGQP